MIPKMDKITSFEKDKYLLSFMDYEKKAYGNQINGFENVRIYDQKSIFTNYFAQYNAYQNKLIFDLYVKTKTCELGEIRKSNYECQECPYGKYSSNVRELACRTCPRNAVCPGKDYVMSMAKYW